MVPGKIKINMKSGKTFFFDTREVMIDTNLDAMKITEKDDSFILFPASSVDYIVFSPIKGEEAE